VGGHVDVQVDERQHRLAQVVDRRREIRFPRRQPAERACGTSPGRVRLPSARISSRLRSATGRPPWTAPPERPLEEAPGCPTQHLSSARAALQPPGEVPVGRHLLTIEQQRGPQAGVALRLSADRGVQRDEQVVAQTSSITGSRGHVVPHGHR
jgi:hypothetical protein